MVLLPYPLRSYLYGVKEGMTNNIDNMRTFPALYVCPNNKGGEYSVYNINNMQRCSVCQIIGIKKKPIPMENNVIETINKQALSECVVWNLPTSIWKPLLMITKKEVMILILILKIMINPTKHSMIPP